MWDVELILQGKILYLAAVGGTAGILCIILQAVRMRRLKKRFRMETERAEVLEQEREELGRRSQKLSEEYEEWKKKYDQLKETSEKLERLAYMDTLTELPNRQAFVTMLDNVMKTLRKDETVAIASLDLDDFKKVNDSTGVMYGDQLLIDVTYRLRDALGENDFLAKMGGDEFAVLTQNITDMVEYDNMLRRLLKVFSYPFTLGAKEIFISASMGVAIAPKDGTNTSVLIKHMASAMAAAKENGKNTYAYYNEVLLEHGKQRLILQTELRTALKEDQLFLLFQPVKELKTGKILGFEALLRWNHPERGILKPEQFLSAAEENGLIVPIGLQVLEKACTKMEEWRSAGYKGFRMSVNLSARQLQEQGFVSEVREIFESTKVDPESFEFEFTETAALAQLPEILVQLKELTELGIHLSLDDFGTGYISLQCLKRFPVSVLKIGRGVMPNLFADEKEQKLLEIILLFAESIGLKTVAVGVEDEKHEEFFSRNHCTALQGFLYAPPLTAEQAEELLNRF